MAFKIPKANIEWNKVPASACIEDRGNLYVAHIGRKSAVIFWGSNDAKQAQAALWSRTQSGTNARCVGALRRSRDKLPGLRGRRR